MALIHKPTPAPQISRDSGIDLTLAAGRAPPAFAALCFMDCYDHAAKCPTPQRHPGRADHWQPPPMPLELIRAAANKPTAADVPLIEYLKKWETGYREESTFPRPIRCSWHTWSYRRAFHLNRFSISAWRWDFLENQSVAAIFHHAALSRAAEDYKKSPPLHPAAADAASGPFHRWDVLGRRLRTFWSSDSSWKCSYIHRSVRKVASVRIPALRRCITRASH